VAIAVGGRVAPGCGPGKRKNHEVRPDRTGAGGRLVEKAPMSGIWLASGRPEDVKSVAVAPDQARKNESGRIGGCARL